MPDTAEIDELRTLQARAYGRGGGLTDAEAARLRELEGVRAGSGVASVAIAELPIAAVIREEDAPAGGGSGAEARPESQNSARQRAGADAGAVPDGDHPAVRAGAGAETPPTASTSRSPRRHRHALVIVAVLIAAAGLGLGWLLFGDRGPQAMALTGEQQEWQNRLLASAEYDAGSIRAVAEEEGVLVWYATKKDGELACVILSDGKNTRPSCTLAADIALRGLYGQFRTPEGEDEREIDAQVLLDAEGDPAVTVSSFLLTGVILDFRYATDEDAEAAAKLGETGFDPQALWVVGRDGDIPLWSGVKSATSEQCLVYDGSAPDPDMVCGDTDTLWQDGGSLVLDRVDSETGGLTRFEYIVGGGSSYLTITKGIERGDASE